MQIGLKLLCDVIKGRETFCCVISLPKKQNKTKQNKNHHQQQLKTVREGKGAWGWGRGVGMGARGGKGGGGEGRRMEDAKQQLSGRIPGGQEPASSSLKLKPSLWSSSLSTL